MNAETFQYVNPARAGMIPRVRGRGKYGKGKPRASGDDPTYTVTPVSVAE